MKRNLWMYFTFWRWCCGVYDTIWLEERIICFDATMTTTTSNTTSSQKNLSISKKCLVVWFGYPRLVAVLCTYHIMFVSISLFIVILVFNDRRLNYMLCYYPYIVQCIGSLYCRDLLQRILLIPYIQHSQHYTITAACCLFSLESLLKMCIR